ncbi:sigma-70 family RNA polymerase sigma factor [Polyangium spumosum]|uniref:RNA polymerase sigma factor n=2 Tax=Polyangium spumosum TaxID=889282 RepID=A0A6N7PTU0_9BACT|nr:sigma-70 family RNA polymerase sigma factor [Polyangium spumosum]
MGCCHGGAPAPEATGALPVEGDVARVLTENHQEFLAFLERRLGDRALSEDILQEAFARGLDRLDTLRQDESAVAWFYRILRNAIVDHRRRRGAAERALESFATEIEGHAEPEQEVRGAICQCVTRLAKTLKPEYRDALERIEVAGVAVKDFAAEQGISPSNAAVRVFRAREALRKQVAASCGTCAEDGCVDCTCEHG